MKNNKNIQAVILAGGMGTRLKSVVSDRSKVVAEVAGKPFITYILDRLNEIYIKDAVICTGYMGEQVRELLGNNYEGISLTYSQENEPLGTAGALRFALDKIESDPVLVMNGDSLINADILKFRLWHYLHEAEGSLLLTDMPDTSRFGRVCVDNLGKITAFEEKCGANLPGCINAGIYILSRKLIEEIPSGRQVSIEKEMFPAWIGKDLYGCNLPGSFLDIGTPESYSRGEDFVKAA